MPSWTRIARGLLTGAFALSLGMQSGCGGSAEQSEAADSTAVASADTTAQAGDDKKKTEAVPVDVTILGHGPIESVIRGTANLEAESKVAVVAEASRRVVELLVEEGDRARKGQVLLRLQSAEQKSAVKSAEINLAKAKREHERQKSLFAQELTTEQAFIDAQEELDRQSLALDDARRQYSYTEVRAPISGTITARHVNLGDQVQIGQTLFDMVDFESLVALVYVPEKNLKDLEVGQQVRLAATSVRQEPFVATVKRVAPVVDPRSGTVKVTVDVGGQEGLRPGLFVEVALITDVYDDALLIPKRALIYDNDQIFIYRLKEDRRVERLIVVPKLSDKDNIMPLAGFAAGDTIVIAGQAGLKDNAKVKLPGDDEEKKSDEKAENGKNDLAQEAASR